MGADRRRWLRTRPGRPTRLDPSSGRGHGVSAGPGDGLSRGMAEVRPEPYGRDRAQSDDRRSSGSGGKSVGQGLRPGESGGSGDPGDAPGGLPGTWPGPVDRLALREHLIRTYIAGDVATPRQGNLRNMRKMAAGEPYFQFGLKLGEWSYEETLA